MMKIALLLNQSHSGGTPLIKVSLLIYNLAVLLENEFLLSQRNYKLVHNFNLFSYPEVCLRWSEEDAI